MKINTKLSLNLIIILYLCSINTLNSQQQTQYIPEYDDRQTQHIQQFARTMADFVATQTFTFQLAAGQQQNFFLWPGTDVQKIRGVFYIDHDNSEQAKGQGLFLGIQLNGEIQKKFVNQRLGVFTVQPRVQPTHLKIMIKSQKRALSVYLSYELRKKQQKKQQQVNNDQNVPTKQQQQLKQKQSKLVEVSQKFKKVHMTIQGQQQALRMVLKRINKHGRKLQGDLKHAHTRIIVQTVIVMLSGLLGMWILKKQLHSGYQLLV